MSSCKRLKECEFKAAGRTTVAEINERLKLIFSQYSGDDAEFTS